MKIKIKNLTIRIDFLLIILLIITIISKKCFIFFYYYFISYFFIIIHEFSHIAIAKLFKLQVNELNFKIGGMCANINTLTKNKIVNIIIFISGPISNLIIFLIFKNNLYIKNINELLFLINLIPIYPLDGYKILNEICSKEKNKKIQNIINAIVIILNIYLILHKKIYIGLIVFIYIFSLKIQNKEASAKNK